MNEPPQEYADALLAIKMTYVPIHPVRRPTVAALQSDLDKRFGEGAFRAIIHNAKELYFESSAAISEIEAMQFIAGWFAGRRTRD